MNPSYCIRNTGNTQNIFRATLILFEATHVEFWTSQKMFYVLLNLKGKIWRLSCTLSLCVNSEKLIFFFFTFMLRKTKRKFVSILYKSKTKATFDGVDKISWIEKIIKKKVKLEMRREGNEVGFQGGTYALKTISMIQHVFTWYS